MYQLIDQMLVVMIAHAGRPVDASAVKLMRVNGTMREQRIADGRHRIQEIHGSAKCLNAINEGEREGEGERERERKREKKRERRGGKRWEEKQENGKSKDERVQISDTAIQNYLAAVSSDDSASPTTVNFLPPRVK